MSVKRGTALHTRTVMAVIDRPLISYYAWGGLTMKSVR